MIKSSQISRLPILGRSSWHARNYVAHDLDIKAPEDETWGPRYRHAAKTVVDQCDEVLGLAGAFVDAVSDEQVARQPEADLRRKVDCEKTWSSSATVNHDKLGGFRPGFSVPWR